MKAAQFQLEQDYSIERRRLINRAILGWGVARGFSLHGEHGPCELKDGEQREADSISVGQGFALDRHGREILWTHPSFLNPTNTFTFAEGEGGCKVKSIEGLSPGCYLLSVHYAERPYGDAKLPDECGCPRHEKNFVCENAVFSVHPVAKCPCGDHDCPPHVPCGCGSHSCLCYWTKKFEVWDCDTPCPWKGFNFDPTDGVPLACIWISDAGDDCCSLKGWIHEQCEPRRILKSNDLLYDLIRGCCLTRIESLSWGGWHRHKEAVPWKDFVAMFDAGEPAGGCQKTKLAVTFTGPVKTDTVTPDCFLLEFIVEGEDTGWLSPRFAPITDVFCDPRHAGDPEGTTRKVTLCVDYGWFQELISIATKVRREGATVRISVNGDYILDCRDQSVDANARGFALQGKPGQASASGNGTPGGVLVSIFRVGKDANPRSRSEHRLAANQEEE
jgi:hypothetical protein